jgi:hypothetical protein
MDDTLALQLVGSYRLRTELRAEGYPHSADEGDLRLAMNDTLSRYYIRTALRGYLRRGDRVLGGTYSEGARGSDTAFVEGRVLTIGVWMLHRPSTSSSGSIATVSVEHGRTIRPESRTSRTHRVSGFRIPRERFVRAVRATMAHRRENIE